MRLFLYTLAHFVVDAICVMTAMQSGYLFSPSMTFAAILVYDLLAFVTQPFVGLWLDKTPHKKEMILLSLFVLGIAFTAPLTQWVRVVLVGLANSLFHVAAGAEVLEKSHNKMWSLGVFVSTGAIGVVLGQNYPENVVLQLFLTVTLSALFAGILFASDNAVKPKKQQPISISIFVPLALLFCICIRSFMGFAKVASFEDVLFLPFILVAFVFAGKFFGGFLCDKWGISKVVWISVPLACLFYFIGSGHYVLWGLGQFFVNISMPITLYLLYRCMPNRPAFSFGLAASFLIPGFLLALLNIPVPDFMFALIFAANLILLFWANKKVTTLPKQYNANAK